MRRADHQAGYGLAQCPGLAQLYWRCWRAADMGQRDPTESAKPQQKMEENGKVLTIAGC